MAILSPDFSFPTRDAGRAGYFQSNSSVLFFVVAPLTLPLPRKPRFPFHPFPARRSPHAIHVYRRPKLNSHRIFPSTHSVCLVFFFFFFFFFVRQKAKTFFPSIKWTKKEEAKNTYNHQSYPATTQKKRLPHNYIYREERKSSTYCISRSNSLHCALAFRFALSM